MAENRAIGIDNKLPRPPLGDSRRIELLTMDSTVIMGKRTYENLG